MGCHISKDIFPSRGNDQDPGKISPNSKKIVQEMWFALTPDLKNFGIAIFVRLFEVAPEIQDLFYNFKDLKNQDELIQSLKELDHVARVMSAFGNCIELLDDIEKFADSVQTLGKVHKKIGIQAEHIGVFGKVVLDLLSDHCKPSWTIEKEKAWQDLFALLTDNFAIGLSEENNNTVT